ncbi:GNAT family N-acetyltransferase [Dysosmobacter sp.]|uniref:GNAT family N-acetyltransferase n=1 Tax=Dysosmobacter sp. TaxID=2591382 RepID=UPI002A98D52F|nr:GNAT family N-acetyltransferase [Dysosmobacter sp.]MDY5612635.1 GNAT family N-acetyltransferase [Dysosmobacter sp.]
MLIKLTPNLIPAFTEACTYERVFGSRIMTALRAYGPEDARALFWLLLKDDSPTAALYLAGDVLVVSAAPKADPAPIAELVQEHGVLEVDTNWDQCAALQKLLGGTTESSYYMVYRGNPVEDDFPDITPGDPLAVFSVLQRSHEYYRTHLRFEPWAEDLGRRLDTGLAELYQLEVDGEVVATGSISSQDDECGVIAAVAVVPEYRHQGLGSRISRFLVKRILEMGKTPRLISGYDEVAELYRQVGFAPCGHWGELYL